MQQVRYLSLLIAATSLQLGNTTKGMQQAIDCGDAVCRDCAKILEDLKQVRFRKRADEKSPK